MIFPNVHSKVKVDRYLSNSFIAGLVYKVVVTGDKFCRGHCYRRLTEKVKKTEAENLMSDSL